MSISLLASSDIPSVGGVEFDAATLTIHTKTAAVTQHPVESGGTITDHITLQPDKVRIDGVFTNEPLPSQLLKKLSAYGIPSLGPRRAESLYRDVIDLYESKTPVDVVTDLDAYTSMAIVSVSVERNASKAGGVFVAIELEKITTVESQQVASPTPPSTSAAASKVPKGKKPSPPASSNQSLLSQGIFG